MSTEPKIYTAKEVASAGFSKEEIDQALATITQKAYEAAKSGKTHFVYHGDNWNFLNKVASHLEDLEYSTQIIEKSISGPYIAVRWDSAYPTKENKK